ncbi:hypothetical protein JW979_03830 [bacterium]|nr:hypothetical protein [candidate division CSSED10-310 bacterium]
MRLGVDGRLHLPHHLLMFSESSSQINDSPPKNTGILFKVGFLIAIIISISPLLSVDVYPFVDFPIHSSLIQILTSMGKADSQLPQDFTFQWFTPYTVTYLLAYLFASFTDAEMAARSILVLYMIATPLAFIHLLKSTGQNIHYAFFVFPALYNFNLAWGFLPFLLSIPVFLFTLSLCFRTCLNTDLHKTLWLGILFVLLFFTHLFSWMLAVLTVLVMTLFTGHQIFKKLLLATLAIVPSFFLGIFWYWGLSYSDADQRFLSKQIEFDSLFNKIRFLPDYVFSGDPFGVYRTLFYCFVGLMLIGMCYPVCFFQKNSRHSSPFRLRFSIFFSLCIIYFICPYSLLTAVWLHNRIAVFIILSAILLLPTNSSRRWIIDVAMISIIIIMTIHTAGIYSMFKAEAQGFFSVLNSCEHGKSLCYLIHSKPVQGGILADGRSLYSDNTPYDHFDQYYQLRKNGQVYNPFASLTHMPIRYKSSVKDEKIRNRPIVRKTIWMDDVQVTVDQYDYFLMRFQKATVNEPLKTIFQEDSQKLTFVASNPPWFLAARASD